MIPRDDCLSDSYASDRCVFSSVRWRYETGLYLAVAHQAPLLHALQRLASAFYYCAGITLTHHFAVIVYCIILQLLFIVLFCSYCLLYHFAVIVYCISASFCGYCISASFSVIVYCISVSFCGYFLLYQGIILRLLFQRIILRLLFIVLANHSAVIVLAYNFVVIVYYISVSLWLLFIVLAYHFVVIVLELPLEDSLAQWYDGGLLSRIVQVPYSSQENICQSLRNALQMSRINNLLTTPSANYPVCHQKNPLKSCPMRNRSPCLFPQYQGPGAHLRQAPSVIEERSSSGRYDHIPEQLRANISYH